MTAKRIYTLGISLFLFAPHLFAEEARPLRVGAASKVINNRLGAWVQGAGVQKKAKTQRDDLEANGLYLSDGRTHSRSQHLDHLHAHPWWPFDAEDEPIHTN